MSPTLRDMPSEENEPATSTVVHRRVEITVEREVLSLLYQPAEHITGRCEHCGKDVLLLTADAAAAQQKVSSREIYRWIEDNLLHFQESPGGALLVCSESLATAGHKQRP